MESELRPHRTTSNTSTTASELFICFATSRLSSSMKLSSKSILSPGRARGEPSSQISLSSSLSRRLRSSGSIKGGGQASPMFPTTTSAAGTNKKRGCGFENPEPSSPKVTCIGQVRVKTKKQGKKMRIIARSRRSRGSSEASFRKTEQNQQSGNQSGQSQELYSRENSNGFQGLHFQNNQQECLRQRNQRWVHLPLTICEALRAFGSEFNCLIPTRSSCLASEGSNNKEKEESKEVGRSESGGGGSSCGGVFTRWFVDLQDGEGKRREIELVVGGEDQERTERFGSGNSSGGGHSQRRQVFEGIEFKEERLDEGLMQEGEEKRRVSICVPPKNALLLMRCRSDPVKMAALANRFWEIPAKDEVGVDDEEDNVEESKSQIGVTLFEPLLGQRKSCSEILTENEGVKEKVADVEEVVENLQIGLEAEAVEEDDEEDEDFEEVENLGFEEEEGEKEDLDEDPEKRQQLYDEGKEIEEEKGEFQVAEELLHEEEDEEEEEMDSTQQAFPEDCCLLEVVADPESSEADENASRCEATEVEEEEKLPEPSMESVHLEETPEEEELAEETTEEETAAVTENRPELDDPVSQSDPGSNRADQNPGLPDCLLLMMCEPKLSMEVSKETWVCTTDFIRCLPERPAKKPDGPKAVKKRVSIDSKPPVPPQPAIQPPRSSCSFPIQAGPVSMATMIGQKLVGSAAYEPFVLTRCKSEPMRSANKLAAPPETCFWKNRKMEPHRRAAMGVGAAGVGF